MANGALYAMERAYASVLKAISHIASTASEPFGVAYCL
jgi:hypothetical protein